MTIKNTYTLAFKNRRQLQVASYFVLLLFFIPICLSGQIKASDALSKAVKNDPFLALQKAHVESLTGFDAGLNLIDKIELRTEFDNLKEPRSEFTTRFSTNGMHEQDAQRKLNRNQISEVEVEFFMRKHETLSEAYQDLVDWSKCQTEIVLLSNQKVIIADRITVLKKKALYSENGDFSALFKSELEMEELEVKLNKCKQEISLFKENYAEKGTNKTLFIDNWLSSDAMLSTMKNGFSEAIQHPILIRSQVRKRRLELRNELEEAKLKKSLDYFQFRHKNRNDDGFTSNFSIGLGFVLPYSGSSKVKAYELKIDALEEERDFQEDQNTLKEKLSTIRQKAELLESTYKTLLELRARSKKDPTILKLKQAEFIDPLVLLNISDLELKRNERIWEVENEIRQLYVDWLDWSGTASMPKETSWLEP